MEGGPEWREGRMERRAEGQVGDSVEGRWEGRSEDLHHGYRLVLPKRHIFVECTQARMHATKETTAMCFFLCGFRQK